MTRTDLQGTTIPPLKDDDIETMLAALAGGNRRVQRVVLSDRAVWIKRYMDRRFAPAHQALSLIARLGGMPGLRPSPHLDAAGMIERECRQIDAFRTHGFTVPEVLYRSRSALVLSDLGPSVGAQLVAMRQQDPDGHEALVERCGLELGRVHGAGLCHGRPHPRDFALPDGQFGFFDFEEDPAAVMPLAMAQARDVWLLLLDTTTRALSATTPIATLAAWRRFRPENAEFALAELVSRLARLLPVVHLMLRVRTGRDLERFVRATEFLTSRTLLRS